MHRRRRPAVPSAVLAVAALALMSAPALVSTPPATAAAPQDRAGADAVAARPACERLAQRVEVPGAEVQQASCLDDLTTAGTAGTEYTDPADWAGLNASGTENPSGVPGVQVDGYFPDDSTSNTHHGWNHDSQFVLRLPTDWNGAVVISGAPGTRTQYAGDVLFSDWVLAQGYAYAMTDKGNNGARFYEDGRRPGDAVAEWNRRVTQLTRAVQHTAAEAYDSPVRRTYLFGISNGGYLMRWQLENRARLYDGGVDWEGTLYRERPPNLLTYLPVALREYPAYRAGDEAAHQTMLDAGFAPGSEFTWDYHYSYYWDLTQRVYREEFDPTWDGDLAAGVPFCPSGTPSCDADYDYDQRPSAQRAMGRVGLTGEVRRPLLTLHGTYDALLPIATDSDVYDRMVDRRGSGRLHRYYRIETGTHVDSLRDTFGDRVRPLLPCARTAFDQLVRWVEDDRDPAPDQTLPAHAGDGTDPVNTCRLR